MSKETLVTLIRCFVVEPIRYKGKRVLDREVELTPEQLAHFKRFDPCPVRVMGDSTQIDEGATGSASASVAGSEPAGTEAPGTDAHSATEPEPESEPAADATEAPARAEADARNKSKKASGSKKAATNKAQS